MSVHGRPVYVATMETRNFTFMAAGSTEDGAVSAMVETMRAHRKQYAGPDGAPWHPGDFPGAHNDPDSDAYLDDYPDDDGTWLRWLFEDYYDGRVIALKLGAAGTRDGDEIV